MYRIVAADSRRAATGKFVAVLGSYNPHNKEVSLKKEEILEYIKKGAQPSSRVVKILKKEGLKLPKWAEANLEVRNKKSKAKEEKPESSEKPVAPAEPTEKPESGEKPVTPAEPTEKPKADDSEKPVEKTKDEKPAIEKDETKPKIESEEKPQDLKS